MMQRLLVCTLSVGLASCVLGSGQGGYGKTKEELADEAAAKEQARQQAIEAAFAKAVILLGSDKPGALIAFAHVLTIEPKHAPSHHNIALIHLSEGRTKQAEAEFLLALQGDPAFGPAAEGMVAIIEKQSGLAGVEKFFAGKGSGTLKTASGRASLAQSLARAGDLERAERTAVEALRIDELSPGAMLALGIVYRRQGKRELASVALKQALGVNDRMAAGHHELGLLYREDKRFGQAVQSLLTALELDPTTAAIANNLASVRTEIGAYREALVLAHEAMRLDPNMPDYWITYGNALRGDQQFKQAELAYLEALKRKSDMPAALYNLGVLYLDNELEAWTQIPRLTASVDYFRRYLKSSGLSATEIAQVNGYMALATEAIEKENKRIERQKRRQEKDAKGKASAPAEEKNTADDKKE